MASRQASVACQEGCIASRAVQQFVHGQTTWAEAEEEVEPIVPALGCTLCPILWNLWPPVGLAAAATQELVAKLEHSVPVVDLHCPTSAASSLNVALSFVLDFSIFQMRPAPSMSLSTAFWNVRLVHVGSQSASNTSPSSVRTGRRTTPVGSAFCGMCRTAIHFLQ